MQKNINKPQYQWAYVIVSVAFALVICGSFMFVKYKRNQNTNNKVDSIIKITSTTAPIRGKPDIIGKEKAHTTAFKELIPSVASTKEQQALSSNEDDETKYSIISNENTTISSINEDTLSNSDGQSTADQYTIENTQTEISNVG